MITEQIRSFPEAPIGLIVGPMVEGLAVSTRKEVDASAHGRLVVSVSSPDAQVFITEYGRGRGTVSIEAAPGTYRILILLSGVSRRRSVTVEPGKKAELRIEWDADAAFNATSEWVGFS